MLTKTNDEALQITGLLLKNGIQAKLIQSNDGFSLQNLLEVRFLLNEINIGDDIKIISDEVWANAKSKMRKKFQQSSKLEVCNNLIKQFEDNNSSTQELGFCQLENQNLKISTMKTEKQFLFLQSTKQKERSLTMFSSCLKTLTLQPMKQSDSYMLQ